MVWRKIYWKWVVQFSDLWNYLNLQVVLCVLVLACVHLSCQMSWWYPVNHIILKLQVIFCVCYMLYWSSFAVSYCSYFGKKIDSEPGRCRRTDGKKWRCSKDAHPDSKYCERHMNRSRNRSRKPVESQTTSQSMSTVASEIVTGSSSSGSRAYTTMPLPTIGNSGPLGFGSNMSRWQMESMPYGVNSKDYRCVVVICTNQTACQAKVVLKDLCLIVIYIYILVHLWVMRYINRVTCDIWCTLYFWVTCWSQAI
jgi:hypothetical protein